MPMGVPSSQAAPAGKVAHFAMTTAPAGWLKCNGAAVSRTAYAALFAAIGTTYGAGDGATTFNLPELRGEFVRGLDDGRGVDTGRAIGSAQGSQMQSHAHGYSYTGTNESTGATGAGTGWYTVAAPTGATSGAAGGTGNGSENRPRNVAALACIKY